MPSGNWTGSVVGVRKSRSYSHLNPVGTTTTSIVTTETHNSARTSLTTAGYTERKRVGDLPENTFGFSEFSSSHLSGSRVVEAYSVAGYSGSEITGVFGPQNSESPPWGATLFNVLEGNLRNQAIAKMNKRIIDSDIDVSVMAGEFRETVGMFKELSLRLREARRALRTGYASGVALALSLRNSSDWANAWLMAHYGIKPLVNDVLGGIKALEKGMLKERYHVESGSAKYQDTRSYSKGNLVDGMWTYDWKLSLECTARSKYRVTQPYTATLASLGLVNPFSLAWELTKLSFVVDWAIGVGAWLNQLGIYFGRTYSGGSVTFFRRVEGIAYYNRRYRTTLAMERSYGSQYRRDIVCNRFGGSAPPVSYLPAFKDPVSLFTVTTSLALMKQAIAR